MIRNNNNILLIIAARNFNETEYSVTRDSLVKKGFNIFIASDAHGICVGKDGMKVKADVSFFNIHTENFVAVVIIGGSGIKQYWNNEALHRITRRFFTQGKIVAAICSAPVLLSKAGLLKDTAAVCYPEDRANLETSGAIYTDKPVVVSGSIITARDRFSSSDFAGAISSSVRSADNR